MKHLTNIDYIGHAKHGDAWSVMYKDVTLNTAPQSAVMRLQSDMVCGLFVNGEFVEATTGRLPERVVCVEITSRLHAGVNRIALKLGPKYFPKMAADETRRSGRWFSCAAAELQVDGKQALVTDDTWLSETDVLVCGQVTKAEYDRFWTNAALWSEAAPAAVAPAVLETVGEEYETYRLTKIPPMAQPTAVAEATATEKDGGYYLAWNGQSEAPSVIYDFGRLEVGYLQLCYRAEADATVELAFDYSEMLRDFHPVDIKEDPADYYSLMAAFCARTFDKLKMTVTLKAGETVFFNLHRRAARYIRVALAENSAPVLVRSAEVRRCLAPVPTHGWFTCDDARLNEMWEKGKYTLHVNKHQEYESCPRHEMQFFTGDATMDELIDYYAFGDWKLTNTSFSLHYEETGSGLAPNECFNKMDMLWDYRAWRIVMAYLHYRYTADDEFLANNYDELATVMGWLIQRMGRGYLIYQTPVRNMLGFDIAVEWTGANDRLGEKPNLNALLYQSLRCMAELGAIKGDPRAAEWLALADKVKTAFNERLWDEAQGAYVDTLDPSYVPQDGNVLAVCFGLCEGERAARVRETLKKRNWSPYGSSIFSTDAHHLERSHQISPMFCTIEAENLFLAGDDDGAMDLIRRLWGTMLDKGAYTFWEYMQDNGTDRWPIPAHAWAGGCTYLLSAFVLGIRPGKNGYETLVFAPHAVCDHVRGVVPTVKGAVGVRGERVNGVMRYTIALPAGVELETQLPDGAELIVKRY